MFFQVRRHIKVYFGKIVKGFADIWHQEWEILCYIAIYDGEVGGGVRRCYISNPK